MPRLPIAAQGSILDPISMAAPQRNYDGTERSLARIRDAGQTRRATP